MKKIIVLMMALSCSVPVFAEGGLNGGGGGDTTDKKKKSTFFCQSRRSQCFEPEETGNLIVPIEFFDILLEDPIDDEEDSILMV